MVSVTMETTGTMLVGSDISAVLTILALPHRHIRTQLCHGTRPDGRAYPLPVGSLPSVMHPNAGLPENVGGHAHYRLTPMELRMALMHLWKIWVCR